MRKAGGIVAIIAGIFGVLAALVTLTIGGIGGAFQADQASLVVGLGWGGILFSFLVIVFGAVSLGTRSALPGILLVLCAICGVVLGGTFVAVFMGLALIGGILTLCGGKSKSDGGAPATSSTQGQDVGNPNWNPDEMVARYVQKNAQATAGVGPAQISSAAPRATFGRRPLH